VPQRCIETILYVVNSFSSFFLRAQNNVHRTSGFFLPSCLLLTEKFFLLFLVISSSYSHVSVYCRSRSSNNYQRDAATPSPLAVESGQRIHQLLSYQSLLYQSRLREILCTWKPVPFHTTTQCSSPLVSASLRVQWHSPHLGHIVYGHFSRATARMYARTKGVLESPTVSRSRDATCLSNVECRFTYVSRDSFA